MFQHPGRDDLDRIERAAGHFEEADLKGERQPVQHGPPLSDGRKLVFAQREEVLDLHRRQSVGKSLLAEMSMFPSAHPPALRNLLGRSPGAAGASAR
jgi:hypothetical protein